MAKAAVLREFGKPLVLEDFPEIHPGPGEVLVKILAAGVCGSDVHITKGEDPRVPVPMVPGHEGVGVVKELNEPCFDLEGEEVKVGDLILWNRGVACGKCYYCTIVKDPSLCPERWTYGIHKSAENPRQIRGCYAEELLLTTDTELLKLKPDDEPAVMVAASCSGGTAAHTIELAAIQPGDVVLIQGLGPLGLFLAAFAKAKGAAGIIAFKRSPEKEPLAAAFGVTHFLSLAKSTHQERQELINNLTCGRGVDVAMEAAGQNEVLAEGLPLVRPGGAYVSVGFGVPTPPWPLDTFGLIVRKNVRFQGVWVSDFAHIRQAILLVRSQPEVFAKMVTHRFPLAEANQALKTVADRGGIKVVIEP